MENLNRNFEPIRLINTNVISRKGYFYGEIVKADTQFRYGNQVLSGGQLPDNKIQARLDNSRELNNRTYVPWNVELKF